VPNRVKSCTQQKKTVSEAVNAEQFNKQHVYSLESLLGL
jgi:hypothetical protein